MNPKIQKLKAELTKNEGKIASLRSRNSDLEKQITELENLDIIGLVRDVGMTPEQLSQLLQHMAPQTEGGDSHV